MRVKDALSLAEGVLAGDARAIARAISAVEDETSEGVDVVRAVFDRARRARLVGITGAPGVGKSTLVDRLTQELRRQTQTVGIVAVDPSSPFSGGAILGDRIRMQVHAGDPGVFVRSMATRGHLGGVARATADAALILAASGKDVVLIETVGVGQGEVDIARTADVSVVIVVPGTGDDVQALKAGIMEIGDIFVVNKADREGANRTATAVAGALALNAYGPDDWRPPVLKTQATTGEGLVELLDALGRFHARTADVSARRRERVRARFRELLADRFLQHVESAWLTGAALEQLVDRMVSGALDPYSAVDETLGGILR